MSEQSSVQWLFQQLWDKPKDKFEWHIILEQAKAMHKEEIVDAHVNGNKEYTIGGGYELIAEHYYNGTFNK